MLVRCASCGARLAPHDPVCPSHGPQALPPEAERLEPPPQPVVPGYTIGKLLGQGGFGAVYRAQKADGQPVALKLALGENPAARRSLQREIWALEAVRPPATPALLGQGQTEDGSPYLALEYVTAPTMAEVMEQMPGHWTVDRAVSLIEPLLVAMAAVHRAGIVHRDIKPENFFVTASGIEVGVRVFDFGLAAPSGQAADADSAREGTPEYLAPEQDAADLSIDPRADVYGLGVLCYELLAGALPFVGTTADIREGHRSRRPPPFARRVGLAKPIERFVMQAMAKDRDRRFADAEAMLAALRELRSLWLTSTTLAAVQAADLTAVPTDSDEAQTGPAAVAAPAAAKPKADQRPMGLLYFKPSEGQAVGPAEAKRLGGELASANAALGLVFAFDHESSDNPVRLATIAAQRLIEQGVTTRALVDAFSVLVQVRPNGQRRFVSAAFARKEKYPGEALGDGVFVTEAALDLVPQLDADPVAGHADLHRMNTAEQRELTVVGAARHAFVGRDLELEQLLASARKSASENLPTIATVVAEGGLGKSELAGALASQLPAKLPGAEVFAFRCQEGMQGGQSRTVSELLRWSLNLPREAPADGGRALLKERLPGTSGPDVTWAAAALALGWVTVDLPDLQETLSAPGALRALMARTLGEALRGFAHKHPLLIVADDGHLADDTLLDGLEYASLQEGQAAIWICLLTRPSLLEGRPLLGARAGSNPRFDLLALRPEDAMLLTRMLLAPVENVPASVLQKLVSRTQGNPLLLVELVRGLKRDGVIRKNSKGDHQVDVELIDQLPDSPVVQWLATREIEALPPDLAAHARLAALLGSDLSDAEMEGVIALGEDEQCAALETLLDAGVGLRRLAEAGILVRHRSGRYSFRYGVLRDATYGLSPEAQRVQVHALAYRFYDRHAHSGDDERLPRLAYHAARAGMRAEARALFVTLGDKARRRHAYLEAANLYSQAREQTPPEDKATLMPVVLAHGLMQFRLGLYERALSRLGEARTLAADVGDKDREFEALIEMATALDFLYHREQSSACVEDAAALVQESTDPLTRARIVFGRARSLFRASELAASQPGLREAVKIAESLGDAGYETHVAAMQLAGAVAASLGNLDEAEAIFDSLLVLCEKHGDAMHETAALGNRAWVWLPRGNFAQLRKEYERGLKLARENCFSAVETDLIHNLAEVSLLTGDLDAADGYAARNVALSDRMSGQNPSSPLMMTLLRGRVGLARNDEATARAHFESMQKRGAAAAAAGQPVELAPSDLVLQDMVDLASRDASNEEWAALLARSKECSVQFEPIEVWAMHGLWSARRGRNDLARQALGQAVELGHSLNAPFLPQIQAWLAGIPV